MCKTIPNILKRKKNRGHKLTGQLGDPRMNMMPAKHIFPTPAKNFPKAAALDVVIKCVFLNSLTLYAPCIISQCVEEPTRCTVSYK